MFRIIGMITPSGHGEISALAETIEIAKQKAAKMRSEGLLVHITAPDGTVISDH